MAPLEQFYSLADDEVLRWVRSPFPAERLEYCRTLRGGADQCGPAERASILWEWGCGGL